MDGIKFNGFLLYLLDDSSEGDAFLCQPVRQRGLSEGVARTVNSASVGKFVLLLQDDQSSLDEALTGRPVANIFPADRSDYSPGGFRCFIQTNPEMSDVMMLEYVIKTYFLLQPSPTTVMMKFVFSAFSLGTPSLLTLPNVKRPG